MILRFGHPRMFSTVSRRCWTPSEKFSRLINTSFQDRRYSPSQILKFPRIRTFRISNEINYEINYEMPRAETTNSGGKWFKWTYGEIEWEGYSIFPTVSWIILRIGMHSWSSRVNVIKSYFTMYNIREYSNTRRSFSLSQWSTLIVMKLRGLLLL